MRKKIGIFAALLFFIGIPLAVKATYENGNSDIKSCGSIIYKDNSGSVELYAEDIALLQEKLASVPEDIFDPVLYSHMHEWEYINVNQYTHTRHCDGCGSSYDMVSAHNAVKSRICTITYEGKEYSGREKSCSCGYAWKEEMYHNLIYSPADATYHTLSCALDGTDYCSGLVAEESEHITTAYPEEDAAHHRLVCDYCGFAGEMQACIFDYDSVEESEDPTLIQRYCVCGNYITEPKETVSGNSTETEDGTEEEEEETQEGAPESISENQTVIINEGGQL